MRHNHGIGALPRVGLQRSMRIIESLTCFRLNANRNVWWILILADKLGLLKVQGFEKKETSGQDAMRILDTVWNPEPVIRAELLGMPGYCFLLGEGTAYVLMLITRGLDRVLELRVVHPTKTLLCPNLLQ